MKFLPSFAPFAPFALALLLPSTVLSQVAVFDFQNAWTGAKEDDFGIVASNSPSVDTQEDSVVSLLSNQGFSAGGYASFSLDHDLFATSATPSVGLNLGAADQTEPTNYISFTVTPVDGSEVAYSELTLYSDTSGANDEYYLQLVVLDGAGEAQVLGTSTYTTSSANEDVHFVSFDFDDFTSSEVTEWRLYAYGADTAINGVRIDDLTLLGEEEEVVPQHFRVYFLGGQSNATGRGNAAELTEPLASEQEDVAFYMHTTLEVNNLGHLAEDAWIKLAPGSGHGQTTPVSAKEFGSELSFGRTMADAKPTEDIAIVKYTHGGSNLHTQWAAGGPMYTTFVETAEAALSALTADGHTYELGGMFWHQGEADTSATNAANYQANLESLIERVRRDVFEGAEAPFIIAGLSDSQNATVHTPGAGYNVVRTAQETVAENGRYVGFVNTDGFSVRPTDTIHLSTEGQIALGEAFALEMMRVEEIPPLVDSDEDGLSDEEEIALGTDPNKADTDGDGQDDSFELRAGTDPLQGQSFFAISEFRLEGDQLALSWPSKFGNRYDLETSADLLNWQTVASDLAASEGETSSWSGPLSDSDSSIIASYQVLDTLNGEFNTIAFDSQDTDDSSNASRLSQGGSLTGGGANSYVLTNAVFDSSGSGSPGLNLAGVSTGSQALAASAGDHFSFTVTPLGDARSYGSLSFFSNQFGTGGKVDISYRIGGEETFVVQGLVPAEGNVAVQEQSIDFDDFTSDQEVTWTFYLYGSQADNYGIRFDDITLRGEGIARPIAERKFYRVRLQ